MDFGTPVAGRYRLDQHIASGGMGDVWRGFDLTLERPIAVKILHRAQYDSERPCDRFAREAKILASLSGPGLVEVHDYGEVRDGDRPMRYIVMELIEGEPLTNLLAAHGRITPEQTLRFTAATAEALDIAHRSGVVHRDVKPGNLLVEHGGGIRVVDFGISLLDDADRLTSPKGVLGTPSYVSPEQIGGRDVSGAADIYSLGAVAYECLAGAPPHTADDPLGIIHKHLHEEPPPLPDDVPPEVAAIVLRCMRKRPEERWRSGTELAAACRAVVVGEDPGRTVAAAIATDTGPPGDADEGSGRRPRYLVPAMAVILALLVTASAAILRPWEQALAESDPGGGDRVLAVDASPGDQGVVSADPTPAATEPGAEPEVTAPSELPTEPNRAPTSAPADEPSPSEEPATDAALPDVIGMDAAEAKDHLNSLGWTDVRIKAALLGDPGASTEGCSIISQNPDGGETAGYDQVVKINYYGLHSCP